jgi:hypothetical protein
MPRRCEESWRNTGARFQRHEDHAAYGVGSRVTRYLVDDLNPTGYAQVVEESVNGSAQRAYSYGLQCTVARKRVISRKTSASFELKT